MEREWKLGKDLNTYDSLLDGLTFDDLITAVHHNCKIISPKTVKAELNEILECRMQDLTELLKNNMDEIIKEARKGRN